MAHHCIISHRKQTQTIQFKFNSIRTLYGVRLPSVGHAVRENQRVLALQEIVQLAFNGALKELRLRDLGAEDLQDHKERKRRRRGRKPAVKLGSEEPCRLFQTASSTFEKENLWSATPTPFSLLFMVAEPFGALSVIVWLFSTTTQFWRGQKKAAF